jgi:uncharacterized repeat protein (TIGR03847 family)
VPEIEFDPVDSIAAGAVGEPGQRAFYIQAEKDGQVLSVLVEKQQVAILAERVRLLLEQVETQFPETADDPLGGLGPEAGEVRGDPVPLFRAVAIGIGFDPARRLVVLELHERPVADEDDDEDDEDDEDDGETFGEAGLGAGIADDIADDDAEDDGEGYLARLYFTAAQARAMAARGSAAVEAGRPPCPLCGGPLDPSGHICPRLNGHTRHDDT